MADFVKSPCPCVCYEENDEAETPETCFCGHVLDEHDYKTDECTKEIVTNG